MQWNVCYVYLTNYINHLRAKKRQIQSLHTHNSSVNLTLKSCNSWLLLWCHAITRIKLFTSVKRLAQSRPNRHNFRIICHLFLFILQIGSFATVSNLLHYIAFYNYTKIGACNQWCTIVQLTKWTSSNYPQDDRDEVSGLHRHPSVTYMFPDDYLASPYLITIHPFIDG